MAEAAGEQFHLAGDVNKPKDQAAFFHMIQVTKNGIDVCAACAPCKCKSVLLLPDLPVFVSCCKILVGPQM